MSLSRLFSEVQPATQEPKLCGWSRPLSGLLPRSSPILGVTYPQTSLWFGASVRKKDRFEWRDWSTLKANKWLYILGENIVAKGENTARHEHFPLSCQNAFSCRLPYVWEKDYHFPYKELTR